MRSYKRKPRGRDLLTMLPQAGDRLAPGIGQDPFLGTLAMFKCNLARLFID